LAIYSDTAPSPTNWFGCPPVLVIACETAATKPRYSGVKDYADEHGYAVGSLVSRAFVRVGFF
jgi:hypothetical protein